MDRGVPVGTVLAAVLAADAGLVALASAAAHGWPGAALAAACVLVLLLLHGMARGLRATKASAP